MGTRNHQEKGEIVAFPKGAESKILASQEGHKEKHFCLKQAATQTKTTILERDHLEGKSNDHAKHEKQMTKKQNSSRARLTIAKHAHKQ